MFKVNFLFFINIKAIVKKLWTFGKTALMGKRSTNKFKKGYLSNTFRIMPLCPKYFSSNSIAIPKSPESASLKNMLYTNCV